MKKTIFLICFFFIIAFISHPVQAKSGCCSHHGGVAGCNSSGRTICRDGTLSPSCTCTPPKVFGCTDYKAKNYNANANSDNGTCKYYVYGCMDNNALNYNPSAEKSDNSCITKIYGCMIETAFNYNMKANTEDGSCIDKIYGCTDNKAENYNVQANTSDESCTYTTNAVNQEVPEEKNTNLKENENLTEADNSGVGVVIAFIFGGGGFAFYQGVTRNRKMKL